MTTEKENEVLTNLKAELPEHPKNISGVNEQKMQQAVGCGVEEELSGRNNTHDPKLPNYKQTVYNLLRVIHPVDPSEAFLSEPRAESLEDLVEMHCAAEAK